MFQCVSDAVIYRPPVFDNRHPGAFPSRRIGTGRVSASGHPSRLRHSIIFCFRTSESLEYSTSLSPGVRPCFTTHLCTILLRPGSMRVRPQCLLGCCLGSRAGFLMIRCARPPPGGSNCLSFPALRVGSDASVPDPTLKSAVFFLVGGRVDLQCLFLAFSRLISATTLGPVPSARFFLSRFAVLQDPLGTLLRYGCTRKPVRSLSLCIGRWMARLPSPTNEVL